MVSLRESLNSVSSQIISAREARPNYVFRFKSNITNADIEESIIHTFAWITETDNEITTIQSNDIPHSQKLDEIADYLLSYLNTRLEDMIQRHEFNLNRTNVDTPLYQFEIIPDSFSLIGVIYPEDDQSMTRVKRKILRDALNASKCTRELFFGRSLYWFFYDDNAIEKLEEFRDKPWFKNMPDELPASGYQYIEESSTEEESDTEVEENDNEVQIVDDPVESENEEVEDAEPQTENGYQIDDFVVPDESSEDDSDSDEYDSDYYEFNSDSEYEINPRPKKRLRHN